MSTDSSSTQPASAASSVTIPVLPEVDASTIYKDGKARVYTKTGDAGTTSLFNMSRRSKADDYFAALGDTDELNAHIGVARAHIEQHGGDLYASVDDMLTDIQSRLFDLGAHLATPRGSSNAAQIHRTTFDEQHVDQLEKWIDSMESKLSPLRNFILPSGGPVSAQLHVCRAVTRRAERTTVPLIEREDADPMAQKYLNRLSDFFFVTARYAAMLSGHTETLWKKPREKRTKKEPAEQQYCKLSPDKR